MRVLLSLVLAILFFVSAAAQQDDMSKKDTKTDSAKKSAAADLYPQPTEAHKALVKAEEGTWDATMRLYAAGPDKPPTEFKGVETVRAIADGLFFTSDFEADFMGGKKFKGHGITGYDVVRKKMVGAWADNMSTGIGTLEGDYDPAKKTITLSFEALDPITGQSRKEKHVIEYKEDGHKLYTIFAPASNSTNRDVKLMEIDSKRRKDADQTKTAEKTGTAKNDSAEHK
jgi:hypothetical protein